MSEENKTSKVEFSRIETNFGNCRTDLPKIAELAESIKEQGLLQPLVVRHLRYGGGNAYEMPDGTKVYDRYILVAGNRRYAAIEVIRKGDPGAFEKVPVTLFKGNEDDAYFMQLTENIQREDLNPADLCEAVWKLSKRGHTQEKIAERLGKSGSWVNRMIKIRSKCTEPVLRALAKRSITIDLADTLASLPENKQNDSLKKFVEVKESKGVVAANAATAKETGKTSRMSVKVVRDRLDSLGAKNDRLVNGKAVGYGTARAVLQWVLGEGEWPKELE